MSLPLLGRKQGECGHPAGLRRYLRAVYRVAGATLTAGTFTGLMLSDVQAQLDAPSGFAVQ